MTSPSRSDCFDPSMQLCGNTPEMPLLQARAFGIDFFSVLARGSQYRVESMMCRLAHSQNYLLLAASKEQVDKCSSRSFAFAQATICRLSQHLAPRN